MITVTEHPSGEDIQMYCDGKAGESESIRIARHIRECGRCRQIAGDLGDLDRALHSLPVESTPVGFTQAVMARLDPRPDRLSWFRRNLAYVLGSVCLAGMAVGILLLGMLPGNQPLKTSGGYAREFSRMVADLISPAMEAISGVLSRYLPAAFAYGEVNIVLSVVLVMLILGLADRLAMKMIAQKYR